MFPIETFLYDKYFIKREKGAHKDGQEAHQKKQKNKLEADKKVHNEKRLLPTIKKDQANIQKCCAQNAHKVPKKTSPFIGNPYLLLSSNILLFMLKLHNAQSTGFVFWTKPPNL